MPSNPGRITPTINHREYRDLLSRPGVVDREWEGLAQQTVIIRVRDSVNPGRNSQTLNIRLNGTQEVISEPDLLRLVEGKPLFNIPTR